jgi:hypothetical protein
VGFDQSPAKRRWIFCFFSWHPCIDHRAVIVFRSNGIRFSLLSYFALIACLISTVAVLLPAPARIYQSKSAVFRTRAKIKIRLTRLAHPPTAINYRFPGIIRRKPPRILIKLIIHPLDFRQLKTTGPESARSRGPNLFDIALEFVWILDEGFNLPILARVLTPHAAWALT